MAALQALDGNAGGATRDVVDPKAMAPSRDDAVAVPGAASSGPPPALQLQYPESLLALRRERAFTLDDFAIQQPLGQGSFGRVFSAKEKRSGKLVVLKQLNKELLLEYGMLRQLQREVEIHCRLQHPAITRMFAYFHDAAHCYIVLEHANNGNLWQKLQTCKVLREEDAARVFRQVMSALAYLHRRNTLHRDLKPENILLTVDRVTGRERVQVTDFGWAIVQRTGSQRSTLCGTLEYLPPELCVIHGPPGARLGGDDPAGAAGTSPGGGAGAGGSPSSVLWTRPSSYTSAFDVYTAGVLLFEMLAGHSPFAPPHVSRDPSAMAQDALMSRIRMGAFHMPHAISTDAQMLLRRMLSLDPRQRPTAAQALSHPWVVRNAGATPREEWDR